MQRTHILGTGTYVPEKVVTNKELEQLVDTSDEWIRERTGIRERRRAASNETTSDMAVAAALKALEMAGTRPEDVELIVVGTVSPDMVMPSAAALVQHKLGAKRAFAFDVSAACAGSLYALSVADQYVQTGKVKRALVIGSELFSRMVDWQDRNTCVLFGDGAGAMVVGPSPDPARGILSTHLHTDGSTSDILCVPSGGTKRPFSEEVLKERSHFVTMNGREVFKFAVRSLVEVAEEALSVNDLTSKDVTHVIAHQANIRILDAVLDRLQIPKERCWLNLERYGNTSSASLPITLDEVLRSGRIQKGDVVAMLAIGAGMVWGSAIVKW